MRRQTRSLGRTRQTRTQAVESSPARSSRPSAGRAPRTGHRPCPIPAHNRAAARAPRGAPRARATEDETRADTALRETACPRRTRPAPIRRRPAAPDPYGSRYRRLPPWRPAWRLDTCAAPGATRCHTGRQAHRPIGRRWSARCARAEEARGSPSHGTRPLARPRQTRYFGAQTATRAGARWSRTTAATSGAE